MTIEGLYAKLIQLSQPIKNSSILDYGCGRGGLIKLLLKESPELIYGVDSDTAAIETVNDAYSDKIKQNILATRVVDTPTQLANTTFDRIICHNVLECVEKKERFIQELYGLLNNNGILVLSHHDFDSALYHSAYKELTRELVHFFADHRQAWQLYADGQMGRKLPGIFKKVEIKNFTIHTWRIVETSFAQGNYSYIMANMIFDVAKNNFPLKTLYSWIEDLEAKDRTNDFYFAIDVVAIRALS